MSKKKLDELFREQLSDFKEAPDDRVWASIEASLNKKKKKRILPIWWQLGGVAAALLVGFILFNPFNNHEGTEQIITDVEQENTKIEENTQITIEDLQRNKTEDAQIEVATDEEDDETDILLDKDKIEIATGKKAKNNVANTKTQIATVENKATKPADALEKSDSKKHKEKAQNVNKTAQGLAQTDGTLPTDVAQRKNDVNQGITTPNETVQTGIAQTEEIAKEKITSLPSGERYNPEQIAPNSKNSALAANQEAREKDSLASINKKSIFDVIENKDEEVVAQNASKRWSAGPSVAPVYSNAIGEGSSVHSIFVPNSKSGNINMSYGLSVAYELTPKLKIRSGLHNINFGYDTNDISFSSSPVATTNGQIDNINYSATSKNLVVSSIPGGSALEQVFENSLDAFATNPEKSGIMTQQLDYLEVPVELNYALLDQKFGLNLIGGVSSLFLMNNSVALTSGDLITEMGDANNVNNLNFSANFGLGVNYKFSPNIQLNLEPVFKYQLNTFSQTNGTFNPYTLGIYSGLSFKF